MVNLKCLPSKHVDINDGIAFHIPSARNISERRVIGDSSHHLIQNTLAGAIVAVLLFSTSVQTVELLADINSVKM
jgi:hypothetical protein